jgi:PHD/YefM family antitoxin component YafN of YafNO toxin-antitoxin module
LKEGFVMPKIMPITELRNTKKITQVCEEEQAPVFVTSNGFNKLVVMSDEVFNKYEEIYNKYFVLADIYRKLSEAEQDMRENKVRSAKDVFEELDKKYGY